MTRMVGSVTLGLRWGDSLARGNIPEVARMLWISDEGMKYEIA